MPDRSTKVKANLLDQILDVLNPATEEKQDSIVTGLQSILTQLQTMNSLIPSSYDYIELTYTGTNLTKVVYKTGGSGGTTVATLTLAYAGSDLVSVTKT